MSNNKDENKKENAGGERDKKDDNKKKKKDDNASAASSSSTSTSSSSAVYNPNKDLWLGIAEATRQVEGETLQVQSEKRLAVHITIGSILCLFLSFIGWLNAPVSVAFIIPAFLGLAYGLFKLFLENDYVALRQVNLASGFLYAFMHFIAEGCKLMDRVGARYLCAILPTFVFHVWMGGEVKTQVTACGVHLLLFVIFAAVNGGTSSHCYDTLYPALTDDTSALTFVYGILPLSVVMFGALLIYSAQRLRAAGWAFTETMASDLARYIREHNFAGARSYVAQASSGRDAHMSLTDLVMCAGVTHAAMFEEISLVPVIQQQVTPAAAAAAGGGGGSPLSRTGSHSHLHHLAASAAAAGGGGGGEGGGEYGALHHVRHTHSALGPSASFTFGDPTFSQSGGGLLTAGDVSGSPYSRTSGESPGSGGDHLSPHGHPHHHHGNRSTSFVGGDQLLSPSKVASVLDGSMAGKNQHGGLRRRASNAGTVLARSTSQRSMLRDGAGGGGGGIGRRRSSVAPGLQLSKAQEAQLLTVTPGFLLLISLPTFPAYAHRQQSAEMLKLLLGEYFDAVSNICDAFDGKIMFCCFTDVYCLFEQAQSACAAALAVRALLEKEAAHHRDNPFIDLQPTRTLAIVFHTSVVSSIVGSTRSVKLGSCDGQLLCEVIKSRAIRAAGVTLPILVIASKLLPLVNRAFEVHRCHDIPKFHKVTAAKNINELGYPILPAEDASPIKSHELDPPLVSEVLAIDAQENVGNLIGNDSMVSNQSLTMNPSMGNLNFDNLTATVRGSASASASAAAGGGGGGGDGKDATNKQNRHRLTPEIAELWRKYDADRSGTLELNEMREVLLDIGIEMTDDELQRFFDDVDRDKSGSVSQEEFAAAFERPQLAGYQMVLELRKKANQMRMQNGVDNLPLVLAAWKRYDTDGNGVLDANEIAKILKDLGINFPSQQHVEWFIERFDQNGTGTIEVDEFASLFSEASGNTQLNAAKARIETVTRVLSNKHGNMTYSTEAQDAHDALIRFYHFWHQYLSFPLLVYILYNYGSVGYLIGVFEDSGTPKLVVDMVTDVLYYIWFGAKLYYLPRQVRGQFLLEREEIRADYMSSWEFYIDVIVVLPLDIFYLALPDYMRKIHALWRINKVLSMAHVATLMQKIFAKFTPTTQTVVTMILIYCYVSHFFACLYLILARSLGDFWTTEMTGWDKTIRDRKTSYLQAILWAMVSIAGQVKGQPVPTMNAHLALLFITVFIGIPLFGVLLGIIGNAVTTDNGEARFRKTIDALKGYFEYTELPPHLEIACIDYYRHVFITTGSLDPGANPLADLPVELSVDVTIAIGSDMLKKVPIFAEASQNVEFVHELTSKMTTKVVEPGLRVMRKGERGSNMYFITYGQFHIVNEEGVQVWTLRKGNFFGEIALLQNVKRTATIFNDKVRFANVLVLEKRDFDQVASIFPECVSKIFQKADARLKELREKEAQEAKEHKEKRDKELKEAAQKKKEEALALKKEQEEGEASKKVREEIGANDDHEEEEKPLKHDSK